MRRTKVGAEGKGRRASAAEEVAKGVHLANTLTSALGGAAAEGHLVGEASAVVDEGERTVLATRGRRRQHSYIEF